MRYRRLGTTGPRVSAIGLGCMGLSDGYGAPRSADRPAQAAIAWVAAQGADIVPLIGARNRSRLGEALGSLDLELTASDISLLSATVQDRAAVGDAFPAQQRLAGAGG